MSPLDTATLGAAPPNGGPAGEAGTGTDWEYTGCDGARGPEEGSDAGDCFGFGVRGTVADDTDCAAGGGALRGGGAAAVGEGGGR